MKDREEILNYGMTLPDVWMRHSMMKTGYYFATRRTSGLLRGRTSGTKTFAFYDIVAIFNPLVNMLSPISNFFLSVGK